MITTVQRYVTFYCLLCLTVLLGSCGSSHTAQKTGEGAQTGAALGALAGVVFGSGNVLGDAVDGAVTGAAVGAGVGYVSGSVEESEQKKAAAAADTTKSEREILEQAFGRDVVESYYALRACEHTRAEALAKAGETSQDANHRLAAIWVLAMTAVDNKDYDRADQEFDRLITFDPDIDTRDQARMETDRVVLEMRRERRDLGMAACSG